ncbi:alpha/beta-hydrolase [Exidia glandulosa HHB12029]|uniref:Carboxypeptidase n=1 Tax=Exidia glandulosa HHB12029 TaxID=1314781 RepID=A0A165NIK1_EXIGL|nr:alpha/beta-hydrolase [Exidia glandulosa HHB12029]
MMWRRNALGLVFATLAIHGLAQDSDDLPSIWPHNYTGIPAGDYSPEWQDYFLVNTSTLPNVTFDLSRSFAGSVSTDTPGHPNNTLFFWAFEKEDGSLTRSVNVSSDDPWLIWLNGGPGTSSFIGLLYENGPIHIRTDNDADAYKNEYSWDTLADSFWLDQPVGTGYATAESTGYVLNEDEMAADFVRFLANLVKVFPSLATRPLHLIGESYAGMYIPYVTKALLAMQTPPVNLAKIAIGDGSIGSVTEFQELPVLSVLETYPQIIGYDQEVFAYFRDKTHRCGYDLNLTYPQVGGFFPTLEATLPADEARRTYFKQLAQDKSRALHKRNWHTEIAERALSRPSLGKRDRVVKRDESKRVGRQRRDQGAVDPWYGCFLFEEMVDYALNFTFPWTNGQFDTYHIPDALNPIAPESGFTFMNDPATRAALHAPQSLWIPSIAYPWGSSTTPPEGANIVGDPSIESVTLLADIASAGIPMVLFSGNADAIVAHRGTEVVIQNFTFGGVQGFSRKPSTPWFDDEGAFAGIVHQERNVTYLLFDKAGHFVPQWEPERSLVFLREFVLGSNATGLVLPDGSVVGGEDLALAGDYLPAIDDPIFYGSATSQYSTVWP